MNAADRAVRCARLRGVVLACDVVASPLGERHAGNTTLLRAVVHEPVLADVEVTRASAASPVIRFAFDQVCLEAANPRVHARTDANGLVVDRTFALAQRLQ